MKLHLYRYPEDPAAEGGSKPAGGGAPAGPDTDLPEWLTKAPEDLRRAIQNNAELFDDVKKGYLRQSDYTKKTQELAARTKKYEGRDLDKEIDELDQWRTWRQRDYPKVEQSLAELEQLRRSGGTKADERPAERQTSGRKKWSTADLLEQERLDEMVEHFETAPVGRMKEWYQQEEIPRLDRYANKLTDTLVSLIKVAWPKDAPTMEAVLREAAATGNGDFAKVLQSMAEGKETVKKEGYNEGYERGLKEAEAKRSATPPPPGSGAPTWRPRLASGKQTKSERFQDVLAAVEKKHGALPV